MNLEHWFKLGMKRQVNPLITRSGPAVDIGCGNNPIAEARALDWPGWDAANEQIPYSDGSMATVWAHHFLEHFSGADAIVILRDIQRVLMPGGVANIVTPYYNSQMQATDLDHKSAWCEETFRNLFDNKMYDKNHQGWLLRVNACWIIGIVERNLALFTQLVKIGPQP